MPIEATNLTPPSLVSREDATPGGKLGKDQFLQLLTTQMRHQDPLNPMDSTATIAQLAQFSALEQMQNVNDEVTASRRETGLLQSMLLQGQEVSALTDGGVQVQGVVDQVIWGPSGLALTIGGSSYPLSRLTNLALVTIAGTTPPGEVPSNP